MHSKLCRIDAGSVILRNCPGAVAAILWRIAFGVCLKGREIRCASETPIRIFVVRFMFFTHFDCTLFGKIGDGVTALYCDIFELGGVDFI